MHMLSSEEGEGYGNDRGNERGEQSYVQEKGKECEVSGLIRRTGIGRSHDGDEVVLLLLLREVRVRMRVREGGVGVLLLGLRVALEGDSITESAKARRGRRSASARRGEG